MYLGRDFGVFGVLAVFYFLCVVFSFVFAFLLVLVRAFLCHRRCMTYCEVPGPHY